MLVALTRTMKMSKVITELIEKKNTHKLGVLSKAELIHNTEERWTG